MPTLSKTLRKDLRAELEQLREQAIGRAVAYEGLANTFSNTAGQRFAANKDDMAREYRELAQDMRKRAKEARDCQKTAMEQLGENTDFLR